MHLWRKVLSFSLLVLILNSTFSTYSYSNFFKPSQEQKSSTCFFLSVDNEDDFDADFTNVFVESVQILSFERHEFALSFLPSRYTIPTSFLQLRILRI